jgi:hypothetical protein
MCSATQVGLRVRRSKALVRGALVRRSAMGPGNPYWKRPVGSTGEGIDGAREGEDGYGEGAAVVVVVVVVAGRRVVVVAGG